MPRFTTRLDSRGMVLIRLPVTIVRILAAVTVPFQATRYCQLQDACWCTGTSQFEIATYLIEVCKPSSYRIPLCSERKEAINEKAVDGSEYRRSTEM
jgi:hypothetical protein